MFGRRKKDHQLPPLTWDPAASAAMEQALLKTPIPRVLVNRVKKELSAAAEAAARAAGRNRVTMDDVIQGMLAKLPPAIRMKAEAALNHGPRGPGTIEERTTALGTWPGHPR